MQKAASGGSHTGSQPDAVLHEKVSQFPSDGGKQRLICSSVVGQRLSVWCASPWFNFIFHSGPTVVEPKQPRYQVSKISSITRKKSLGLVPVHPADRKLRGGGEAHPGEIQPYARSKSINSDGALAWTVTPGSSLKAAPSLTKSFWPLTSTAPRSTCSQA